MSAARSSARSIAISLDERWVDIKKRQDSARSHPEAVYAHTMIDTKVLAEALVRIGEYVAEHGIEGDGPYQPARDLLLRTAPRLGGQAIRHDGEATLDARFGSRRASKAASCQFRDRPAPARPTPARG